MRDALKLRVKRPSYRRKPKDKAKVMEEKMTYITRRISTGDFDPENTNHSILFQIALSKGIIDKDCNIKKEEYLLCKSKRLKK